MAELTFLRSLDAFHTLSREEAHRLLERSERRVYPPGTTIVRCGEPGDAMFVILEGQVEIRVPGDDGRVRFTTHLGQGDLFGEMALLTGQPRTADVVAVSECSCMVIEREHLEAQLRAHPPLAAFLTEILGRRILESDTMRRVGKYHLVGVLGRGSMATVFEGYHVEMRRPVAVKMLSHSLVFHGDMCQRFRNEARVLASLRHENIVQVYDMEEAYRTYFIVMERLEGTDLERHLTREGPLDGDAVRRVLYEVASALAYAHDLGVVHRDLKPSNLFLLPDGSLRLVDFGIATGQVDRKTDPDEELLCSPAYVAPEAIEGRPVDGRSDLYSLGATAYRLLTGCSPFPYREIERIFDAHLKEPFPDPAERIVNVPEDVAEVIRRTTKKRPADRFQHASEIVDLLAPRLVGAIEGDRCDMTIRLRFPERERDQVAKGVDALRRALDGRGEMDVIASRDDCRTDARAAARAGGGAR